MQVRFWGTRGSIPSPGDETIKYGGNTTCLEVELDDGTLIIFDAGTGIKRLGQRIIEKKETKEIHLFFTHSHWDHIQGFPLFLPAYSEMMKINIYCSQSVFQNVKDILSYQMDARFFPVKFSELKADINFNKIRDKEFRLNSATLSCIENNHPGNATGFRVTEKNKSLVFITDNELLPKHNEKTQWQEFVSFCQNADILIHDAHYLNHEMTETAGWGHSSYEQAFELGIQANVKHLIFFHHDPDRSDELIERIVKKFKERLTQMDNSMKLDAAIEGSKYRL